MPLDRDTRRGPRTRVLAVITRRSAHCSLLRTHKPGSPLLLCLARSPMPWAQVNPCSPIAPKPGLPKSTNPYPISRDLDPGMSSSDKTLHLELTNSSLAILCAGPPVCALPPRGAHQVALTCMSKSICNMHVGVCKMHVGICYIHVGFCNMHVGICKMHVGIGYVHVGFCNMHVGICNLSTCLSPHGR